MKEYIVESGDALYDENTGKAVFNLIVNRELIRCKDCKYYDIAKNGCNGFCFAHAEPMYSWDFCSSAEWREE